MTQHSYTGIRTIMASGMKATGQTAGQKRAFARLTGEQILAGLTDEQKSALAVKLGVKASPAKAASTAKATAAKADDAALKASMAKGFSAGREVERARVKAVAEVALERGQAADALRMLATDAEAPAIIAKLRETNLLADAMRKRFGGAA